jgi:hypothetical protein
VAGLAAVLEAAPCFKVRSALTIAVSMRYPTKRQQLQKQMTTHEFTRANRKTTRSSERSFGIVIALLFIVIGVWPIVGGHPAKIWPLALAGSFLAVAFLAPFLLIPLNRLWFRLGMLLYRIVNPVAMAILFFGAFTPMGLVLRILGHDLLRLRSDPGVKTYWITRDPPGPRPGSMSKQF